MCANPTHAIFECAYRYTRMIDGFCADKIGRAFKAILIFFMTATMPAAAQAAEIGPVNVSGFVGVETRFFTQTPQHTGQETGPETSLILNPEFRYRSQDRAHQFSFIPFYRHDSRDDARSHFDLREVYWLWIGDEWEVLTGVNKVFWGVAESRHLVNIINQIDSVEDLDGEDYLGQPMINIATQQDWGRFETFILPGFRERTFPGTDGRFRAPLPVDTDNARYESDAKDKHVDLALRYSHYFGDWDVGLSYFYGTDREPVLTPNGTGTRLIPTYNLIHQAGADIQYTIDAWLWKLEAITREGQGDRFLAGVGGFEYTFYQIYDQSWDLGILAEYQYDGRDAQAPATTQDNDVFMGARLALNDIQDTELLAGFSIDHRSGEQFYNIEAERRLGDQYEIELRARFFAGSDPGDDAFAIERDDYIQLRLSRYF